MKIPYVLAAGLVYATQCQGAVTLYGIVDNGYRYDKTEGSRPVHGLESSNQYASRWGMRGTESLGGGLEAFFVLESAISTDTGTEGGNRLFNRASYLGLSGPMGTVRAGRTTHLAFEWAPGIANPFGLGYGRAQLGTTFAYNDNEFGSGRVSNAIYYYSPSLHGFQGGIGYSFQVNGSELPGSSANNRMIDLALRFTGGPLGMVAAYEAVRGAAGAARPKVLTLGASYRLGRLTVNAGYGHLRQSSGTAFGVGADRSYSVGGSFDVGSRGRLLAAYQTASASKLDNWAIGYSHALSKRTSLYTFVNWGKTSPGPVPARLRQSQFAVGMSHRF
ncbi:MAG: porin [Alcaligenaceae bacterium]|nr:porin [Alcaligenaceae bacterium SAGV5]MPS50870.1 porin [Alcaligenaceae bacterium SAGV3]MPT59580.1 porin [Alcaligenaceae bacterium]